MATAQEAEDVRDRKWREDLLYLKERFPAYDKTLTPLLFTNSADSNKLYYAIQKNSLEAFLNGVDSLYKITDQLSDEQIMIGICKLIALSPNAHTRFYLFRVRTILNNLPVGISWFDDKLYITAAPKNYSRLLGAQITAINAIPIDSVKKIVDELISGNQGWKNYMSLYFLRSPQVMKGLSLAIDKDQLKLDVVLRNGKEQNIEMKADFVPQSATLEVWKDLSPVSIKKDSLVHVLESQKLPIYLQNADKDYHYQ